MLHWLKLILPRIDQHALPFVVDSALWRAFHHPFETDDHKAMRYAKALTDFLIAGLRELGQTHKNKKMSIKAWSALLIEKSLFLLDCK